MNKAELIGTLKIMDYDLDLYRSEGYKELFLARDVAEMIDYAKRTDGTYRVDRMIEKVEEDEKLKLICNVQEWDVTSDTKKSRTTSDTKKLDVTSKARKTQEMYFLTYEGLIEVLFLNTSERCRTYKKEVKRVIMDIRLKGYYIASKKDNEWLGLRERGINTRRNWVHEIENKMILDSRDEIDDFIERLSRTVKIELGIPYNPDYDEYHQRDSWSCEDLYRVMEIEEEMCEYVKSMDMDGFFGCFSDIDKVSVYNHLIEVCAKHQI